jgi:hypothetical protein
MTKFEQHLQATREALDALTQVAELPASERAAYADTVLRSAKILEAAGCYIRRANVKGTL